MNPLVFYLALSNLPFALGINHVLKEKVHPPYGWSRVKAAPAKHVITLQIGLRQRDFEGLEQRLYEVSDPNHPNYGNHLSKREVESYVAPDVKSIAAVDKWLESHGINLSTDVHRSDAQDWVKVNAPVSLVENLLKTTYSVWENASGENLVRTTEYHLPMDLHQHIDVVQPTTSFSMFKPRMRPVVTTDMAPVEALTKKGRVLASNGNLVNISCNATIAPSCLYQLYDVNYNGSSKTSNSIAISSYLENYFNLTDLSAFYKAYVPAAVGSPVNIVDIAGGINNESQLMGEAALDAQYAFGLAYPAKNIAYTTGGRPPIHLDNFTTHNTNEPYQEWLGHVLSQKQKDLPLIITTSYGDDEQTVPLSYAKRICAGFAQLGARGISVLFSSGDYGVGDGEIDPSQSVCLTNDGQNRTRFLPDFPATCPYVTSVGGTVYIDEQGVDFSGGGFSGYFSRPLYQELAVLQANKHIPEGTYRGLYNAAGRAIPDISAQSVAYLINIGGSFVRISGTSAATPAVAGIFAKLNDMRLKAHLPPLGFLNPLLYSRLGYGFNDITVGNNPGCGTPGFNARPGYDLVTGLGTPNFPQLTKLVFGLF